MKQRFKKNGKYYTISIYTLVVVALSALIIKFIINWSDTSAFFGKLISTTSPFILGFFIAYLINPLVKFLDRNLCKKIFRIKKDGIRKAISILLSYIIVFGIIITLLFYIIPQIGSSLMGLKNIINPAQSGVNQILAFLGELEEKYPDWNIAAVSDAINQLPRLILDYVNTKVPVLIPSIYNMSLSLISSAIKIILAIMVSCYMLIDKNRLIAGIKRAIYSFIHKEKADNFISTMRECNSIFSKFIIGKTIDSTIIGILCWIIMTALKLPYPLVISVIVGITNMIPYFGPYIGAVPGVLLILLVDFNDSIIFLIMIIILQQFDGLFLGPKILGESTGLRPIWIIFAISIGGWIAGPIGMFLGVPAVAVISFLTDRYIIKRLKNRHINPETLEMISMDSPESDMPATQETTLSEDSVNIISINDSQKDFDNNKTQV